MSKKRKNQPLDEALLYELQRQDDAVREVVQELVNLAVEVLPIILAADHQAADHQNATDHLASLLEKYGDFLDPAMTLPIAFRKRLYEINYGADRVEEMVQAGLLSFDSDQAFRQTLGGVKR